ncbi:class A beta-lactamase [Streptomyces cinnamoneus]|uniref:Beta-lactamase n=1 Tax=Streptomyces cinnamoneus TaxID=53446 RepID=A0A2G1XJU6_STRCJ|nr:class A beta-lactamase [Streptomyces cinnamoneus]PHQ51409.1 class A beta-lactamase [Streptomyces cinnamoneus]PPT11750.1 class A beta-lactamase [Streptomyces cinnamoneus]
MAAAVSPQTAHAATPGGGISRRLSSLEREHSARLGVFARNLKTGRTVLHRADERFPMCSVFKTLAVAAVLRDLDRDGEFLAKRVHYTEKETKDSGYAPRTGLPENLAHGMTVEELCGAAISFSDNAAANLLMRELGGPTAVTRFCRSAGDTTTRLDRWEPALNTAEPWRTTDTTTPRAIGHTYARLVLGDVLAPRDRERLTGWLLANTTSAKRFRLGLPAEWTVADKTGGGDYGTNNDVGLAWTPDGTPIVLAVLTTKHEPKPPADDPLVARAAELLATALV